MFKLPKPVSGFEANQLPVLGSIALYPPSPLSTLLQLELVVAVAVAGDPLSWVPPRIVLGSVACWEKLTNCVIEPRFWLRSSNAFVPEHEPVVSPVNPFNAR